MKRVKRGTRELWPKQDQHEGDRWRLFSAVGRALDIDAVLYPGSFVDPVVRVPRGDLC